MSDVGSFPASVPVLASSLTLGANLVVSGASLYYGCQIIDVSAGTVATALVRDGVTSAGQIIGGANWIGTGVVGSPVGQWLGAMPVLCRNGIFATTTGVGATVFVVAYYRPLTIIDHQGSPYVADALAYEGT